MLIKDIMTTTVEVVSPSTTLADAADRMRGVDIGILPVLDADKVVGVVTDRDMTVRAIGQGLDPRTAMVGEVMTRQVRTCFEDESVEDAAEEMAECRLRRLVVLDRTQRLAGIVSLDDVATGAENPELAGETLERTASRSDRMHGRYERILVALDGSRLAERVLPSIEPLAQKFGSRVILLRVATPVYAPSATAVAAGVVSAKESSAAGTTVREDLRRESMSYLATVQRRLEKAGLTVQSECPEGPPSEVILRCARRLGVDLIALTTHGRTGVDRLLLGSVAEDVIRQTPCPVHLVRVQSGH